MSIRLAILLLLLQVMHFIGDFTPLSTPWMLRAKLYGRPHLPIIAHALIHGFLMGLVLCWVVSGIIAFQLAAFQAFTHFIIDLGKGRVNGRFTLFRDPNEVPFWTLMGFDQLLHQIVILIMVMLVSLTVTI